MNKFETDLAAARERLSGKRNKRGKFLRGPIPLGWLSRALRLPGKSGNVGLAIWHRSALEKQTTDLAITSAHCMRFGVDSRRARVAAIRHLEKAGLVRVTWHPNKAPRVEIVTGAETPVPEKDCSL